MRIGRAFAVYEDGQPQSIAFFRNEDVVRHPLVQAIVRAYDAHEKKTKQAE